ncbi:MAG: glycosyltransferase family 2 protein [Candidatus Electrothrix sp. MAN1_4]|nr:glycosyltransferase family 2 protein [Candidatus Electrothrix sp. MAN1_4]
MKISIAMATYNGAQYLQEQLDSFLAQTRHPDELVVYDDCSSDRTVTILETFRKQAPFAVHIYRNEINIGYIKNFEKAISSCKGDIIFLSDQDDGWFPEKLYTMTEHFEKHPDHYVLLADMMLTDANLHPTPYTQLENILSLGNKPEAFVTGCGTAIRREWLELALPIPSDIAAHDNWLHRLASALGVRALYEKPLQYYRRHGENSSNWLASTVNRVTVLDDFLTHRFHDATASWMREKKCIMACYQRIEERTSILQKLGLLERQQESLQLLREKMKCFDRRIQNMSMNRFKRLPNILKLWIHGGYSHFSGWKSAIKDIVR